MAIVKWWPFFLCLNVLNSGCDLPTVHISLVLLLIQAHESTQCVQTYPLCICLQSIYWYRDSDTLWIHSMCFRFYLLYNVSSPSIDTGIMIYPRNPLGVWLTHPLCICLQSIYWYRNNGTPWIHSMCVKLYTLYTCLQFIYWYRNNDTPWIHSVCVKLTHCAYVPGPSVDAGTMILPESTQCVASASITARLVVVTASIRIWGKMHREHWLLKFHVNISVGVQGFSDMTFVWLVAVLPADKFENRIF